MIERFFQLSQHRTTVGREMTAGLVTFLTMSYILFVHPAVLSKDFDGNPTGLNRDSVLFATCVASAFATFVMGLYAKYPIALAPGMGQNFFFVTVIMTLSAQGVADPWRIALGMVLVAGLLFLLLTLLGVREAIINVVRLSLRNGIVVGIGIFITFIGLKFGNILVTNPGTFVALNPNLRSADSGVFWLGLLVTVVLHVRKVRGAILWGIVASTILSIALGKLVLPQQFIGLPSFENSAVWQFDVWSAIKPEFLWFVFIFLYMDLFDTVGTLIGVTDQAGLVVDGKLPRIHRALTADALGTVAGACLGMRARRASSMVVERV